MPEIKHFRVHFSFVPFESSRSFQTARRINQHARDFVLRLGENVERFFARLHVHTVGVRLPIDTHVFSVDARQTGGFVFRQIKIFGGTIHIAGAENHVFGGDVGFFVNQASFALQPAVAQNQIPFIVSFFRKNGVAFRRCGRGKTERFIVVLQTQSLLEIGKDTGGAHRAFQCKMLGSELSQFL